MGTGAYVLREWKRDDQTVMDANPKWWNGKPKIDRVVFGATIDDAAGAGFCELHVAAATLAQMGRSRLRVEGGLLREECTALFSEWKQAGLSGTY